MKQFFEEYGGVTIVLVVIAVLLLLIGTAGVKADGTVEGNGIAGIMTRFMNDVVEKLDSTNPALDGDDSTTEDDGNDSMTEDEGMPVLEPGLYDLEYNLIKEWDTLIASGDVTVDGTTLANCNKEMTGILYISDDVTRIYGPDGGIEVESLSLKTINKYGLSYSNLLGVYIPDSVTDIGIYTFQNCKNLKYVRLPNSYEYLEGTFWGCTSLEKAPKLPEDCMFLNYVFNGCTSLKEVELPNSAQYLDGTFEGCTGLVKAPKLPENAIDIQYIFAGCTSLTEVPIIPNGVENMYHSFAECTSLTKAPDVPENVYTLSEAFMGCSNLTGTLEINTNHINTDDYYSYSDCIKGTKITHITGSCNDAIKTTILGTK